MPRSVNQGQRRILGKEMFAREIDAMKRRRQQ